MASDGAALQDKEHTAEGTATGSGEGGGKGSGNSATCQISAFRPGDTLRSKRGESRVELTEVSNPLGGNTASGNQATLPEETAEEDQAAVKHDLFELTINKNKINDSH